MASTTTQAIATRVPNDLADHLRREAERTGTTVSEIACACLDEVLAAGAGVKSLRRTVMTGQSTKFLSPDEKALSVSQKAREHWGWWPSR